MILISRRRPHPAKVGSRGARPIRPQLESLEGRALMATTALDPSFGTGGFVLGPTAPPGTSAFADASAVAVQADGKIVVVATSVMATSGATPGTSSLSLERFNVNGTLDTTFGTDGVTSLPLPTGVVALSGSPHNVIIQTNGSIAVAATAVIVSATVDTPVSFVARVTSTGALDATFGTNGEVTLPVVAGNVDNLALQADGKLVAAGISDPTSTTVAPTVTRLTTTGALDTTFNQTGELTIALPETNSTNLFSLTGLVINPAGQFLLAGTATTYVAGPPDFYPSSVAVNTSLLIRVTAGGTVDTSFGTAGIVSFASTTPIFNLADLAALPDGKILISSGFNTSLTGIRSGSTTHLTRLLADGTIDPSFQASPKDSGTTIALGPDGEITLVGSSAGLSAGSLLTVERFLATGAPDTTFGTGGRTNLHVNSALNTGSGVIFANNTVESVAISSTDKLVIAGGISSNLGAQTLLAQVLPVAVNPTQNDYDGDGRSDIAAALEAFGLFAIRQSDGAGDIVESFGPAALGGVIPAPGDYDGDGKTDVAAYLPAYGVFVYRPSSGGADVVTPFGIAGAGQSIPAPGDYDGDGKTDIAVYLPTYGILAYRPSSGGADVLTQFGIPGAGQTIPAPGDYDGDGKTDIAAYLPALGLYAYRPSGGGADVLAPFGIPGAGQTIPAPGDYDGDGKTDIAAYFPASGYFAYRPSGGGADVLEQFGLAGSGASIPAPGDYDGDGRTDVAVYLPSLGLFAYRPSSGGADVIEQFGASGTGQTVPASSIAYAQPSTSTSTSTTGTVAAQAVVVNIPLPTDEMITPIIKGKHKKKA